MKNAVLMVFLAFIMFCCPVYADKGVSKDDIFEKHIAIKSDSGLTARFFHFSEKGNGKIFIERKEVVIATIQNAMPISWHPTEDILVVKEYRGTDDDRCYILNIGAGEYKKDPADRSSWILGDPHCNRVKWSKDGSSFTLYSSYGSKEYKYNLSDLVKSGDKK
ncbi:MAG: hypothetical protein LWY06_18130 [Firmicutes bacterium]|nr:hypothetical protein [Bacillota bacterium]